jgi:CRP-like cAMP-binding protein
MKLETEYKKFIEELLNIFLPIGEKISVNDGDVILRTGDQNDDVYVLLQGCLKIIVQNEIIGILNEQGQIVGEISALTVSPCLADVMSSGNSDLLKININSIKNLSNPELSKASLYKMFCLSLSSKLEQTNIKAKEFERLSHSLEEEVKKRTADLSARNHELNLGYGRLSSLHEENMKILKRLSLIEEEFLRPSIQLASKAEIINLGSPLKDKLLALQHELNFLNKERLDRESIKGKSVLVIEPDGKLRSLIKIALGGSGITPEVIQSLEEASSFISQKPWDIIFLTSEYLELAELIKINCPNSKLVISTKKGSVDHIGDIRKFDNISNIISYKEGDLYFNSKGLLTTFMKMISGDIFGIEKYINWGAEIKQFQITESEKRSEIRDQIVNQLNLIGIRKSLISRMELVLEELLMNALYDAPIDEAGKSIHNHKSRQTPISLSDDQAIKVKFATDGVYAVISVEDPFGSFKKDDLIDYLENNLFIHDENFNEKKGKGGAGKGLYLIAQNSNLVVFNVAKFTRTEVIALFSFESPSTSPTQSFQYFEI